jgi:CRP-like cAMP-binding protein
MLEELSPALRHECMHHIYAKILVKVPFLRDSPQIVQSAVIACVKPILCCKKDYLAIEGQVLDHIFLVASGAVEVINNKGLVSRTYGVGSFFGEKCAFHSHYLSTVSYRAKVDLEFLTIERNDFVDLLNTYEAFGETFMMICQKREDHKKGDVQGGTRMTGKLSKNAASMVRPVTPPPGTTWRPVNVGSDKSVFDKCKTDATGKEGGAVGLQVGIDSSHSKSRIHDVFEDESLPALLDKLQYNLGSQLDDIQDHLDHLEDRLEDLEEGGGGGEEEEELSPHSPTTENIRFLDGSSIRSPKAVSSNTLATVSTVGSAVSSSAVPTAVGTRRRRSQLVRLDDVTGLGEAVDGPTNERARSVKRLIARENSRFRSVQSQRQLSSSPHEY